MSGEHTQILKFKAVSQVPRIMTWEFWLALARVDVMVREVWAGTDHAKNKKVKINSEPGAGAPTGQIVVKGLHGTVIWMTKSKRLSVTKGGEELMRRLRKGFETWDIETDGKGFTQGKLPKQVAQTLKGNWE